MNLVLDLGIRFVKEKLLPTLWGSLTEKDGIFMPD